MQVVWAPSSVYSSWHVAQTPTSVSPSIPSLSSQIQIPSLSSQIQIPRLGGENTRKQVEKHLLEDEIRRLRGKVASLTQEVKDHKRKLKKRKHYSDELLTTLSNLCDSLNDQEQIDAKKAIRDVLQQFGTEKEPMEDKKSEKKAKIAPGVPDPVSDPQELVLPHPDSSAQCKPSRFIFSVDKKPLKLLRVSVQQQYTLSKKETLDMTTEQKSKLMPATVRIMGSPDLDMVYFVAKDVCLLIHIRKGNVAKSISQFNETEKARMPVLCERSNGVVSTHVLTVLTVHGVIRLLKTSQSKHAPAVLKWIIGHIEVLTGKKLSQLGPPRVPSFSAASSSTSASTASSASSTTATNFSASSSSISLSSSSSSLSSSTSEEEPNRMLKKAFVQSMSPSARSLSIPFVPQTLVYPNVPTTLQSQTAQYASYPYLTTPYVVPYSCLPSPSRVYPSLGVQFS